MADLSDAQPAEEKPDLSDLMIVTLNVETREGRQLSMVWAAEDCKLALTDDSTMVDRIDGKWTFTVHQTRP